MRLYHITSLQAAKKIVKEGVVRGKNGFVSFSDRTLCAGPRHRDVALVFETDTPERVEYTESWAADNLDAVHYISGHDVGDVSEADAIETFLSLWEEYEFLVEGDFSFSKKEIVGAMALEGTEIREDLGVPILPDSTLPGPTDSAVPSIGDQPQREIPAWWPA